MNKQKVLPGDLVIYVLKNTSEKRPAIVTYIRDEEKENQVDLTIFNNTTAGQYANNTILTRVPFNAEGEPGTWHHREQEEQAQSRAAGQR